MNVLEKKMLETLIDLKENHHAIGVKCEFAAEGTRLEEALRLKEIIVEAGLDLTIKIGGCEDIKDMYDAKTIGAKTIVAPMIESPYAMEKYLDATKVVFPKNEWNEIKFLINIETIYGYNCLDDILNNSSAKDLAGVVLGRSDMAASLCMKKADVNHPKILEIAKVMAEKIHKYDKEFVIGGGVSASSLPFFRELPEDVLNRFETRKVIFDAPKVLADENADKCILKALELELMWIKNKKNLYNVLSVEDTRRIELLEARYSDSISFYKV